MCNIYKKQIKKHLKQKIRCAIHISKKNKWGICTKNEKNLWGKCKWILSRQYGNILVS